MRLPDCQLILNNRPKRIGLTLRRLFLLLLSLTPRSYESIATFPAFFEVIVFYSRNSVGKLYRPERVIKQLKPR